MVLVGLGNPGEEYAHTRHNVGFMVADAFAKKHTAEFTASALYALATTTYAGKRVHIAKPLTYMNDSGRAVRHLLGKCKAPVSSLVVVTDEYNFPVGKIRLSARGSDGGHNGMGSVIHELGTSEFMRLRLGIGHDFGPGELVNYVLSPFPSTEFDTVNAMIADAVALLEHTLRTSR